jgi:hypothetical protein
MNCKNSENNYMRYSFSIFGLYLNRLKVGRASRMPAQSKK